MELFAFTWTDFAQQVVSGLATGSIYASLALAIVIIYRSTGVINFAQGEMAMFSTFIAWWLIADPSGPEYHLWIGFVLTLVISFAGGVALERLVIRPVEGAPVLTIVMVTLGLGIALFGLAAWIWGADTKRFPSAFSTRTIDVGGVVFSIQDVGFIAVTFGAVGAALGVLSLHEARPRHARRCRRPPGEPPARSARQLDARARLGASPPCSARSRG